MLNIQDFVDKRGMEWVSLKMLQMPEIKTSYLEMICINAISAHSLILMSF